MKQGIKQFSSCPGLTKPGISMCSSQDELLGTPDAVSKRVWRSTFPTPSFRKSEIPFMRPVFKWLESDWLPFVDWSTESTGLKSPL